jgi:DNA-binding response OmpR family regulator
MRYRSAMARIFHVLLIEDDPLIVFAMTAGLADAGHVVSSATSVSEAVETLSKEQSYDVILLDLRLGPDRGEDIFVSLRDRGVEFAPVIVVSAQTEAEIERAVRAVPAVDALRKPISIDTLCDAMERAVA